MNPAFDYSILYWVALILPSLITGAIAIISLVTNYRSAKNSQLKNMIFTQKEKVADQFIEKSSELLAISDPLVINARINEFTPTIIEHSEFMGVMQDLLSIDQEVQTLGSVIKLHTWSIYEKTTLPDIADMFSSIDVVQDLLRDLVLKLIKLHASNTEAGRFTKPAPMVDKQNLEREFSEKYREPYIDMSVKIMSVARLLRNEALEAKREITRPKKKKNKETK